MRLVADTHAIVWYAQNSTRLSSAAAESLADAEREDGIVVYIASLIDLWYVTQTTRSLTVDHLAQLQELIDDPDVNVTAYPVDAAVARASWSIPRPLLRDPWDRLILATAIALDAPLVSSDAAIRAANLVPVIW